MNRRCVLRTAAADDLADRLDEALGAVLGQDPATITIAIGLERSSIPLVGRALLRRVGPAPRGAGPPSEPDVPVSEHPAQASPGGSGGATSYDPLVEERVVRGSVHRDDCRGV